MASEPGSWVAAGLRLVSLAERRSRGSGGLWAPSKARAGVPLARLRCSLRAWAFIPEMGGAGVNRLVQWRPPRALQHPVSGSSSHTCSGATGLPGRDGRLRPPAPSVQAGTSGSPRARQQGSRWGSLVQGHPREPQGIPAKRHLTPGPCPAPGPSCQPTCVCAPVHAQCAATDVMRAALEPPSPRGSGEAAPEPAVA